MHQTAQRMGSFFASRLSLDDTRREEVTYGAFVLLQTVVTLGTIAILAIALGVLPATVAATVASGLLRRYSGGNHLNGPWRCAITTAVSFVLCGAGGMRAGRILGLWSSPARTLAVGMVALACFSLVYRFAPVEAENRPLRAEHKRRLRRDSLRLAAVYLVLLVVLAWIGSWLAAPVLLGFLMQCFTLTPAGRLFMRTLDQMIDRQGR